jgi:hypothetical protein
VIDSSKSPTPLWQRYALAGLLTVLVVVVGYMVWAKELHHPSSSASPPPPAAPVTTVAAPAGGAPVTTTIPGGIAVSSRDPFSN